MIHNQFQDRWEETRVRRVIDHYELQTEDEALAEDETRLTPGEPSQGSDR
jgi:hypothetical protein